MTPFERAVDAIDLWQGRNDVPDGCGCAEDYVQALQDAGLLVTEQDLEFRAMVEARKKRAEGRRAARQQAQL